MVTIIDLQVTNDLRLMNACLRSIHDSLLLFMLLRIASAYYRNPVIRIQTGMALRDASTEVETLVERCTRKITESLQPTKISVSSSNDDPNGSHIQIQCIADIFQGKTAVQRQRLVFKAIWEELEKGEVHAVDSIVAKTPQEVSES